MKLIKWAAIAFLTYMLFKAGLVYITGLLIGLCIFKYIKHLEEELNKRRPISFEQWYGSAYGINSPSTSKEIVRPEEVDELEKLISKHQTGRYELTFDNIHLFVSVGGRYFRETRITEEEKRKQKRLKSQLQEKQFRRRLEKEQAAFNKRMQELLELQTENKVMPVINPEVQEAEYVEIIRLGVREPIRVRIK